jgi:hypothetical protein
MGWPAAAPAVSVAPMLSRITQALVVGAERSTNVGDEIALGSTNYRLPELDAGERLLTHAAAAALSTLALTPAARPRLQFAPPLDADPRLELGTQAGYLLQRMLTNDEGALLQEALTQIGLRGKRVPLRLLPGLLQSLDAPARRSWLASIRCSGVQWLAAQNPDWRWALGEHRDAMQAFELEVGAARHAGFLQLRRDDAAGARELLIARFKSEPAEERATLLGMLELGLSLADEAVLETALDDRAKTVRQTAASLLSRLVGSALAARLQARALALIRMERVLLRKTLRVDLPADPDKQDERDGIDVKAAIPGLHNVGPRQLHLAQLVAAVPPKQWAGQLNLELAELIKQCAAHEFAQPLCAGLALGATRHTCFDTLRLLSVLSEQKATHAIYQQLIEPRLPELPDFAEFVAQRLRASGSINMSLLAALPAPWPDTVSQPVMQWARDTRRLEEMGKDYSHYEYVALLKLAALRVAPAAHWLKGWPMPDPDTLSSSRQRAAEAIDGLLSTLQSRIEFLAALELP